MNGSELLLNNAERYGLILAKENEAPRRLSRPNIGMSLYTFIISIIIQYLVLCNAIKAYFDILVAPTNKNAILSLPGMLIIMSLDIH